MKLSPPTVAIHAEHSVRTSQAVELYSDTLHALSAVDVNAPEIWNTVSRIPDEHVRWKMEALNSTYEVTSTALGAEDLKQAQLEVTKGAARLAAHKLPRDEISGIGLPGRFMDDSNEYSSVELKDVRLLGRAWDNSGRNPLLLELTDAMIGHLDGLNPADNSKLRSEEYAILYKAAKTGISYRESVLEHLAKNNDISVYSKAGKMLIRLYSDS